MSASDALGPQFVSHADLAEMYSGDYDVKMKDLTKEPSFREQSHPAYLQHGFKPLQDTNGYIKHVAHLAADIRQNGLREPIEVRNGNVIPDGHHRALAAMRLKLDKVPVKHTR